MKLRTFPAVLLGTATAAALVAGCSSNTPGTASPSATDSGSASTTTTDSGSNSAPKVSTPLDAAKFIASQCSVLTTNQVSALDIVSPISGPHKDPNGTGCGWTGISSGGVSVDWETVDTNGLSDLYTLKSDQAYFQPTTVDGYPAVFADPADGRPAGQCTVNVGVNDHLFFIAAYETTTQNTSQACNLAQQAASDVIKNLGGA